MANAGIKVAGAEEIIRKLRKVGANVTATVKKATQAGTEPLVADMAAMAPGPHIKTRVKKAGRQYVQIDIGPDKAHWHYRFLETGAGPHEITSRSGKMLVFQGRRGRVVIGRVSHPGFVARPFMRPVVDHAQGQGDNSQTVRAMMVILRTAVESV